ncbi:MAG: co-chaperone GroES [Acidimicrobiales bacterium]|nr:co-chaperone GroES [Acidimicrobiales bacterium]MCB1262355.1 co-chaperone GroES [Acidimicrobiales bacterium]
MRRDGTVSRVTDDPTTSASAADAAADAAPPAGEPRRSERLGRVDKLPIQMLNDRILVSSGRVDGERRSTGGILIPATAQMGKRLIWAEVVAVGPNVRAMEPGDQVLFNPEDRYEVDLQGEDHIILRERDVHAVAAKRLEEGSTGLYL